MSWEMANGPIPEGMVICHACDVPPCVNPSHLFLGTQADNVADCISKGRHVGPRRASGDAHWTQRRFKGMTPTERFWSFVADRSDPTSCWNWTNTRPHADGYGEYWDPQSERLVLAHRYAWELEYGPLPDGHRVMHTCRNRDCVNPAHLWGGLAAQFHREYPHLKPDTGGRRGEANGSARLNPDAVRDIRRRHADGEGFLVLANAYGVTSTAIRYVVKRETWAHVD